MERKFAEGLQRKGNAARIRETVSQALRESAIQSRPKLVEPVDYETFVVKNKVLLHNDPQRDMLCFPHDDVLVPPPAPARKIRTAESTVPAGAEEKATSLMVKECLKTYTSDLQMVKFKYQAYGGSYQQLPNADKKEPLQEHIFEIDAEVEEKDDDTLSRGFVSAFTKKGWLLKGPDSGKDNVISFTRQFKRRFFVLKQQSDYTHILEIHKDDKKLDAKGVIFLDLAQEVIKNPKKGKHCFEIRMQDRPSCLLAAESEADASDWISTLNKVINAAETASQISRDSFREENPPTGTGTPENYKESSINHPVVKYCRETDSSLAKARQETRQNLFAIYPDMRRTVFEEDCEEKEEGAVDVFPRQYSERFLLRLESLKFGLQLNLADDDNGKGNKKCNPEPFFLTFALYDASEAKKISEDFHLDPNEPEISAMIPADLLAAPDKLQTVNGRESTSPQLKGLQSSWLEQTSRQGIFSIVRRHQEIYLVARIEKVLQGGINQCIDPYIKGGDSKMALKVHRQMKQFCSHIGHYRMPFAWSAIALSPDGAMPRGITKLPIFKQETSKFSEEETLKLLVDLKRCSPKLLPLCSFPDTVTPSLVPVKPFAEPVTGSKAIPTFEVEEFIPDIASLCSAYDSYINNLYVMPMSLKYDGQKSFAKARNISCCVELRDSDEEGAVPLQVKVSLPVQLREKHHLLFRFYHVSCEASKSGSVSSNRASSGKKKDSIEMPVGFAWLPLLQEGRPVTGEKIIPVASSLPAFYLSHDSLSLTKSTGPDVKWVDGGKPLFKLNLHLVSTVYTQDHHLHNFFLHCQRVEQGGSLALDMNSVNKIKSLLAMEVSTYVHFLPTLVNQLLQLLSKTVSEDVAVNSVRVLIHIVSEVHSAHKHDSLEKYVKYMFRPDKGSKNQRTVHEELSKHLTTILRPANTDPLVVTRFLKHAWFFFDILLKSMTLYLIDTDRVRMPRNERFAAECQFRIQNLLHVVTLHIIQKCNDYKDETKNANHSLANFVKSCFTLMDRGYVFRLVSKYIENFNPGDSKTLHDFKFEFLRIVCSHEHFIPLSLPLMRKGMVKNFKDLKHDYNLSEEFRHQHYLVGLLLFELRLALTEDRPIRRAAITVMRNQLAKHAFDDRYASRNQQGRIAALYLPLIGVLLDSKNLLLQIMPTGSGQAAVKKGKAPAPVQNGDATSHRSSSIKRLHHSFITLDWLSPQAVWYTRILCKNCIFIVVLCFNHQSSIKRLHHSFVVALHRAVWYTRILCKNCIFIVVLCFNHQSSIKRLHHSFVVALDWLSPQAVWYTRILCKNCIFIVVLCCIGQSSIKRLHHSFDVALYRAFGTLRYYVKIVYLLLFSPTPSDAMAMIRALQEANISTEVGLVVLDILSLFCTTFKKDLEARGGDNDMMHTVFQIYLNFLRSSQSETLQKHVFGAWRAFIKKFQSVLFKGSADMCGELCFEILRCCNSKLNSTRREACALLYLLMRSNFEFSNRKSFTRVHLQVIISVSQLIGVVVGLSTTRFQESLAIVNNYAGSDKSIQKTPFPGEVRDLTKRIRTVLMATAQMKENENDPELLVDLQYSLAQSYASTPELRKTWLHAMAKLHIRKGIPLPPTFFPSPILPTPPSLTSEKSPFLMCSLAMAWSQVLRSSGVLAYPQGCSSFGFISPNIVAEEAGIKDDSGMQDVQYTEETLVEFLEKGAEYLEKAERFEVLGDIYKLIIPIYEKLRNFQKLESSYQYLSQAYSSVLSVMKSGKRLLGKYYMVTLYGQVTPHFNNMLTPCMAQTYFEDEDKKEYIYKEPKVTSLTEIRERLQKLFSEKFGRENVQMINDSKKISVSDLDPKYAYVQVIYVTPYFEEKDLGSRVTDFERNNNVRSFMYELPFTRSGKGHGSIQEQHKRRFIVTTTHSFPFVKKRIEVKEGGHREIVLTPIEVAIDEMQIKVADLKEAINSPVPDMKRLHLKLQGAVSAQVNAGPLAYAEAFLNPETISKYPSDKSDRLKAVFREFVATCKDALDLNAKLISTQLKEYHESLKAGFMEIAERLSVLLGEKIVPPDWANAHQRQSMTFISGASGTSIA
ncbi:hypothetical protein EGW08_014889 [Elysia chlorotica]|uniref:Dedicator of cytokinesis protein 9 n=1 Tax=Elysia chlorotica TaxID=188477 RepID=A0A3S0ZX04_ELYCH|nr:hypothetical protein EGW08_014889 [Elysia chlorotica]